MLEKRGSVDSREAAKARKKAVHEIEELSRITVDCAFKLHSDLGPGMLESVYELLLAAKLSRAGLVVARQKPIPIDYDGISLAEAFRADIVVDNRLIVEIKSVERLTPTHGKQLLTYLRLSKQPLGLLINFGAGTFREGVKRVVNGHTNFAASRLRVHRKSLPS